MRVANMVASGKLKWILDEDEIRRLGKRKNWSSISILDLLVKKLPVFYFRPEILPAIWWRVRVPVSEQPQTSSILTFEFFDNGKFNCQNALKEEQIYTALKNLQLALSGDLEVRNKVIKASITAKPPDEYAKEIFEFIRHKIKTKSIFAWRDTLDFRNAYKEYLEKNNLPDMPEVLRRVELKYQQFLYNARVRAENSLYKKFENKLRLWLQEKGIRNTKAMMWKQAAELLDEFLNSEKDFISLDPKLRDRIAIRLLHYLKN
ncbi:MAG: hypothetical protein QXZ02_04530 [Candidatus Bathyarchaeia archaeon]